MLRNLIPVLLLALPTTLLAEPLRVYMIGNSLTDEVKYDTWVQFCKDAGSDVLYARKMIPGAPICWHRDHPDQGFNTKPYGYPDKAFREHPWDVLTMQPFVSADREIPAAVHYAELLWANCPNARIYIYAQWPNRRHDDWEKAWIEHFRPSYDDVLAGLRDATDRDAQTFMIPAGHAMHRLQKKMALGLVPGYMTAWDLYQDGVHVNNVGSYLVGLSYYSTIFGRSPVGLPVGGYQGEMGTGADYHAISPELAEVVQETVWEAVTAHIDSGVTTDTPVAVTLPGLLPAVVGEPYSAQLDAAYGTPPYAWSLADDFLPEGLTLDANGLLRGTPPECTKSLFAVRVTDAEGQEATGQFALSVAADSAPKVVTIELPELRQGRFVDVRLLAEGGNGVRSWSVSDGELPEGLVLEAGGRVYGSPAASGPFEATLTVTDADGANPETDSRSFNGTISPADPESVCFARKAEKAPTVDGKLDPAEGWDLQATFGKTLVGTPNNRVRFDAQWHGGDLYVGVEVDDASVITQEGWGKRHYDMDCIVFYFDGLNNREATYNFDDRRLVLGPTTKGSKDDRNSVGPRLLGNVKSLRTTGGFKMEASFKLSDLGVPNQTPGAKYDAAGAVLGFDLVNRDIDVKGGEQTRLGWQGTADNPDDASQFGTLILNP